MIREIKFTVSADTGSISPAVRQWGGMQYEDKATNVVFDISSINLKNALYRIDFNSPSAGYQPSVNLVASGGVISRMIPKLVTQFGGEVQVTAVITECDDSGEPTGVCYSFPVIVYFTDVQKSRQGEVSVEENISEMQRNVTEMTQRAEAAADTAEVAKEKTLNAKAALEGGAEIVFLGGDAQSAIDIDLAIDDVLSVASENAVQNKPVAKEIQGILSSIAELKTAKVEYVVISDVVSLTDWCDANIRGGVRVLYVGTMVTNTPASSCLALLINNTSGSRKALILFDFTKIYFNIYYNSNWRGWNSIAGTAITV